MQSLASRTSVRQRSAGLTLPSRKISSRPAVICRVVEEVSTTTTTTANTAPKHERVRVSIPQWIPGVAHPILHPGLDFLAAQDFKLQETWFYREYLSVVTENEFVNQFTGFKEQPEIINGRGAMLGFIVAAVGEIFSGGTVAEQLSAAPRPVLAVLGLIIAGSIIPVIRGTSDGQLESIKNNFGVSQRVFTPENERIHGRLAMVGLGSLLALELVLGHKIL